METDTERLLVIDGVGKVLADSIRNWCTNEANRQLINQLAECGVNMEDDSPELPDDHPMTGLTFVITGTLDAFSRTEAANAVKERGGKASGSVSKRTHYVVAGANAGSKLETANRLGVPVMDEEQFKRALAGDMPTQSQQVLQ